MSPSTPEQLARLVESQAEERLRRERRFNDFLLARCPPPRSTERYQRGPLPPSDPRFYTYAEYIDYRATREMGRFNPTVSYPAPERRR